MKVLLLILVVSTGDGKQPTIQQIPQPDMATCQAQAKIARQNLSKGPELPGEVPIYIVRTSCITGS